MNVSIAMCTFNGERFLEEQLASLREQTLVPGELIVCDDGSTDRTFAILEGFRATAPFPVRLHRNSARLGSTRNFAQAIARCEGEVIALCDQDDRWAPQKLARSVQALAADDGLGGVFSNASLMDTDGDPVPGDLWSRVHFDAGGQRAFARSGPLYLVRHDTVTGAAFVFRARRREQLLPIPETWVHDGWIAFLLAARTRLQPLPEHLLTYRLHTQQQVGAKVVPWHAHLSTRQGEALAMHERLAARFAALAQRLEEQRSAGDPVAPAIEAEVRRKVHFEASRAMLLRSPRWRRLLAAPQLLPDYTRYEKGLLSLLRDLAHASGS